MLFKSFVVASCLAVALAADPADVVTDNKPGTVYVSTLTGGPGPVLGQIQVTAAPEGVTIYMSLNGFDISDSTEYSYHIHANRVPESGDCAGTAAHFDDRGITDDFVCDKANPQLCQLGDLSGKHGAIVLKDGMTAVNLVVQDKYLSLTPGDPAFIGDKSIVVHRKKDKARLRCGNLAELGST